ncbi:MAG TPA: hypothetical protein VF113_08430 [Stellaceae bacterium]
MEFDIFQTPGKGGTQRARLAPAQRYAKSIHQDGELVLPGLGKDGGPLRNDLHSDYRGRETSHPSAKMTDELNNMVEREILMFPH